MYLTKPCPRPTCGKMTLNQPEKHGAKLLCRCDSCKRYARYIIRDHVDGSQNYELAIEGGDAEPSEVISKRVPARLRGKIESEMDKIIHKFAWKHNPGKGKQ